MHKSALAKGKRIEGLEFVEGILTLLFSMMKEWEEAQVCIDCSFVE